MRSRFFLLGLVLMAAQSINAQAKGEATYKAKCIHCHGADGNGKGHSGMKITPADLRSDEVQKKTDEELYESIAFGKGHKDYAHAFAEKGLSTKEIAEVVTYIRGFAKKQKPDK